MRRNTLNSNLSENAQNVDSKVLGSRRAGRIFKGTVSLQAGLHPYNGRSRLLAEIANH
jgi:hypothetical protein